MNLTPVSRVKRSFRHLFQALALTTLIPIVASAAVTLTVDLSDKKLQVMKDGEIIKIYDVAVGAEEHPTPTGDFTIRRMIWNPGWVPPKEKWAEGKEATKPGDPENPMRRLKIFFKEPDYYIHGTLVALDAGESHGCIRMRPAEVTELGKMIMASGGKPRPAPWYKRILRLPRSTPITLADRVAISVVE